MGWVLHPTHPFIRMARPEASYHLQVMRENRPMWFHFQLYATSIGVASILPSMHMRVTVLYMTARHSWSNLSTGY